MPPRPKPGTIEQWVLGLLLRDAGHFSELSGEEHLCI
jgi:hypothetical protein